MTQTISRNQRFRRYGETCPICGGHSGSKPGRGERCAGYLSSDGEYVYCQREQYAGKLELNENTTPPTFPHKLYGSCNCGQQHNPARTSNKSSTSSTEDKRRIVAEYSYLDATGRLAYQSVRYEPKDFRQRRPDGKNGWLWNIEGVTLVPFHLPELRKHPKATVYIPEGEKDVLALEHIGLVATTNVMGAGKWRDEYSHFLKGRHVVILPDNDKAGKDHAQKVRASLTGIAASIGILELPTLPEKGDVSDWLEKGGTRETLEAFYQPPKRKFLYASEVQPEPVDYLWTKRLAKGMLTLLVGDPGLGKSMLCAMVAAETTKGSRLPDGKAAAAGGVIIMAPEDSYEHTIVPRLKAAGADLSKVILLSEVTATDDSGNEYSRPVSFPEDAGILEEAIVDCGASLAIIDPVLAMVNGKFDTHKDQESRLALSQVLAVAKRQHCAVLGLFHLNKAQNGNVLYRSAASIAFIAMARIGLFLVPDPDNPENGRVLVNHKNNLAAKALHLRFTIEQTPDEIGYIKWNGLSTYSEQELLNQATPTDNHKSEQETGLMDVLRENKRAMTPLEIHQALETQQSLNALEQMLKRKLEQGVLMRPLRGFYTYNGNPLYTAQPNTTYDDVSNVSNESSNSSESNVSSDNIMSTDITGDDVSFGNASEGALEASLAKTDKTDMTFDREACTNPFFLNQRVITPDGMGKVARVDAAVMRVLVGFSPGLSRNYPYDQVTAVQA